MQAVDIDKEIVIVDDGSTDGTFEFLTELAEKCKRTSIAPFSRAGTAARAQRYVAA